jgi:3-hydroxyacyl-CoA dehydrogenase
MVQDAFARHRRALKGRQTQFLIVDALRAAEGDFLKGMATEKALSDESLAGRESKALQHAFFSERRSSSIPGLPRDAKALPISRVVVVGAGTMGSGIAMACANAGLKVSLVDSAEQGLDRGRKIIRSAYEADAKRGRLRAASVDDAVGAIQFSLDKGVLATADLVVEAVFENMELKKSVLADIGARVAPGCIIATNTSSLSLSELGQASGRPDMVLGLHFFSPAHIMKLLEIVRSDSTSPVTLLTGLEFARRIRKIPVVSGDGFAFIGNRMMLDGAYREGELMLLEGAGVDQLDRAVENFGFAMGPNRVNDMAGVDIGTLVREQLALRETRPDPYSVVSDALTALGRVGQKVGKGFYDYAEDPRSGRLDPAVDELIQTLAAERGITRRSFDDAEIAERFVLQLINVGAQILEEGIAYRASDIDVVWVHGYGFPRHLGGPMFYADTLGLHHVLDRIKFWQARYEDYWQPSELLVKLAESGSSFSDYDREQSKAGVCNELV